MPDIRAYTAELHRRKNLLIDSIALPLYIAHIALRCCVPSCANGFVTLLVLRLACLSNVKVMFWLVLERHNLHVSLSEYTLVT